MQGGQRHGKRDGSGDGKGTQTSLSDPPTTTLWLLVFFMASRRLREAPTCVPGKVGRTLDLLQFSAWLWRAACESASSSTLASPPPPTQDMATTPTVQTHRAATATKADLLAHLGTEDAGREGGGAIGPPP